jgi:streptogramin lyase
VKKVAIGSGTAPLIIAQPKARQWLLAEAAAEVRRLEALVA